MGEKQGKESLFLTDAGFKADSGDLPLGRGAKLEVLAWLECEHAGDDVGGELLDLGVQVADHGVVIPPRVLEGILDLIEIRLELREVLNRAQLRIGLGKREERFKRLGEQPFSLGISCWTLDRHGARAGVDHVFKGLALMARVAFDCLHQIGDQVVASLELNVDVRPRIVGLSLEAHEGVIDR